FRGSFCCSKGASDHYVLDYARAHGVAATVLPASTVYGPRQIGDEEQGWVSHLVDTSASGGLVTIFGAGMPVRDLLFADDFVELLVLARARIGDVRGRAFNVGGGPHNELSLLEVLALVEELSSVRAPVQFDAWRSGEPRWYVSDVRAAN